MITRFNNITNHINTQQLAIVENFNKLQDQLKNTIRSEDLRFKYLQFLQQINYNIDLLQEHLNNISETVILAKLNIISKQILNKNELKSIHDIFLQQNLKLNTDESIYEMLELQAYYNNTNIIFNIKIPVVTNNTFNLFHVLPLPIHKNKTIISKPYVLVNDDSIQYFNKKCFKIENMFYCKPNQHKESITNSSCIGNLIQNKPASCELHNRVTDIEIYQPESDYLALINIPETIIHTNCVQNQKQTIKGSVLIHFNNCEIKVNDITYTTATSQHWDEVNIHPTIFNQINSVSPNQSLFLKHIENYQFTEFENYQSTESHINKSQLYTSISVLTIFLLIIILLNIFLYLQNKQKYSNTIIPINYKAQEAKPIDVLSKPQFVWP